MDNPDGLKINMSHSTSDSRALESNATALPLIVDQITPLIITYNEAPNIERVLEKLAWAKRILVIDSGSTDGTLELLKQCPQVTVLHRTFDSFAAQCQFGLAAVDTEWALSMDADYVLSDDLVGALRSLPNDATLAGYEVSFKYCVWGKPLVATLYPPRTVLYRVSKATYADEGHGHRVRVEGRVIRLRGPLPVRPGPAVFDCGRRSITMTENPCPVGLLPRGVMPPSKLIISYPHRRRLFRAVTGSGCWVGLRPFSFLPTCFSGRVAF